MTVHSGYSLLYWPTSWQYSEGWGLCGTPQKREGRGQEYSLQKEQETIELESLYLGPEPIFVPVRLESDVHYFSTVRNLFQTFFFHKIKAFWGPQILVWLDIFWLFWVITTGIQAKNKVENFRHG